MKNHSLKSKGLSLSQASSISNLCNQRATEITNILTNVNNYSKKVKVEGQEHVIVKGKKIPENVIDLLKEKAELHACQGFLMENIKTKDELLEEIKHSVADISNIEEVEPPKYIQPEYLQPVDEDWGWGQLSVSEYAEYLEAEAFASHFGQFFHKGQTLDVLRKELPGLPAIEWMVIKDGVKSPVTIDIHHTSEELLSVHEKLAEIHRGYEQKVNYFKAKVKNLVTAENARIANVNADAESESEKTNETLRNEHDLKVKGYLARVQQVKAEFEKDRQAKIKETAALRIEVHPRFQKVVDIFLKKLPESQD